MNGFLIIINALYRVWFYILVGLTTIVLAPLLFVFILKETHYYRFYTVARIWGKIITRGMGFYPKVKHLSRLEKGKSYMLVANHTSMMDIMLLFAILPKPFVFVGKKELARLPIFGFFYKRSSILVDRKNIRSRQAVFEQANRRLKQGNSICIFPEGGVPEDPKIVLDRFKDGAFRMAIDHQIPVVPIVLYDNKKGFPYHFQKAHPGALRVKIFQPVSTENLDDHKGKINLRNQIYELMYNELVTPDF